MFWEVMSDRKQGPDHSGPASSLLCGLLLSDYEKGSKKKAVNRRVIQWQDHSGCCLRNRCSGGDQFGSYRNNPEEK